MLPPMPQRSAEVPGSQLFPMQQPEQLAALQAVVPWQMPIAQVSPVGQTAQVRPPKPHALPVVPPWQAPVESQQPEQLDGLQATGAWQTP